MATQEKKRTLAKDSKSHQNDSKRSFKIKDINTQAHKGKESDKEGINEKFQNLESRLTNGKLLS